MNILRHWKNGFKGYFKFSGKTGLEEYRAMTALYLFVDITYEILAFHARKVGIKNLGNTGSLILVISFIILLFIIIPNISVGFRRSHDIGKSGWHLLIPFYYLYLLGAKPKLEGNPYDESSVESNEPPSLPKNL